jgi:hypothetical protein
MENCYLNEKVEFMPKEFYETGGYIIKPFYGRCKLECSSLTFLSTLAQNFWQCQSLPMWSSTLKVGAWPGAEMLD